MTRLFRSKSCGLVEFNAATPSPIFHDVKNEDEENEEDEEEEEEEELDSDDEDDDDDDGDEDVSSNPVSTPFISSGSKVGGVVDSKGWRGHGGQSNQFAILDILVAALKKSLVTCSVEREDVSSLDISWPTEVRHVSHVTFDRFNGFLGLPSELEPEVPKRVPSAR